MFNAIKKRFSTEAKEAKKMVEAKEQTELSVVPNTAEFSAMVAQIASQSEALLAVQAQFAELTASFAEAQAQLAAVEADKQALVATAAAAKLEARKQRVETTIGTAKAESVLAATAGLDDASFEAVVGAFAASLEVEAKSAMFSEVGVAAEIVAAVQEESLEMKIIKAKQRK